MSASSCTESLGKFDRGLGSEAEMFSYLMVVSEPFNSVLRCSSGVRVFKTAQNLY